MRNKSTLLKGDEAKRVAKQCSRQSPSDFTGLWEPSPRQIAEMEKRLSQISTLKAECCIQGMTIDDPGEWFLQYAPLEWRGKQIIYISAIGREQPTEFIRPDPGGNFKQTPSNGWKEFAVVICDGGNAWGVIYDPRSGKFSDLSVNGIG